MSPTMTTYASIKSGLMGYPEALHRPMNAIIGDSGWAMIRAYFARQRAAAALPLDRWADDGGRS